MNGIAVQLLNEYMATLESSSNTNTDSEKPHRGINAGRITRRALLATALVGGAAVAANEVLRVGFDLGAIGQDIQNQAHQKLIQSKIDSGEYDMTPPPGRIAEDLSKIPTRITAKDIPSIPDIDNSIPEKFTGGSPQFNSSLGFDAIIDEQISSFGSPGNRKEIKINPQALVTGYIVAKEKQPDGSYLFAVEVPYLNSPKDILKRSIQASTPELKTQTQGQSRENIVNGTIIWIKTFKGTNPTHTPFKTTITWGEKPFGWAGLESGGPEGTGDKELAEYTRIGDKIRARVTLGIDLNTNNGINGALNRAIDDYVNAYRYANSIPDTQSQFRQIIDSNMQTAKKLIADSGKPVLLSEQVEGKRYVFTPDIVVFLPK